MEKIPRDFIENVTQKGLKKRVFRELSTYHRTRMHSTQLNLLKIEEIGSKIDAKMYNQEIFRLIPSNLVTSVQTVRRPSSNDGMPGRIRVKFIFGAIRPVSNAKMHFVMLHTPAVDSL